MWNSQSSTMLVGSRYGRGRDAVTRAAREAPREMGSSCDVAVVHADLPSPRSHSSASSVVGLARFGKLAPSILVDDVTPHNRVRASDNPAIAVPTPSLSPASTWHRDGVAGTPAQSKNTSTSPRSRSHRSGRGTSTRDFDVVGAKGQHQQPVTIHLAVSSSPPYRPMALPTPSTSNGHTLVPSKTSPHPTPLTSGIYSMRAADPVVVGKEPSLHTTAVGAFSSKGSPPSVSPPSSRVRAVLEGTSARRVTERSGRKDCGFASHHTSVHRTSPRLDSHAVMPSSSGESPLSIPHRGKTHASPECSQEQPGGLAARFPHAASPQEPTSSPTSKSKPCIAPPLSKDMLSGRARWSATEGMGGRKHSVSSRLSTSPSRPCSVKDCVLPEDVPLSLHEKMLNTPTRTPPRSDSTASRDLTRRRRKTPSIESVSTSKTRQDAPTVRIIFTRTASSLKGSGAELPVSDSADGQRVSHSGSGDRHPRRHYEKKADEQHLALVPTRGASAVMKSPKASNVFSMAEHDVRGPVGRDAISLPSGGKKEVWRRSRAAVVDPHGVGHANRNARDDKGTSPPPPPPPSSSTKAEGGGRSGGRRERTLSRVEGLFASNATASSSAASAGDPEERAPQSHLQRWRQRHAAKQLKGELEDVGQGRRAESVVEAVKQGHKMAAGDKRPPEGDEATAVVDASGPSTPRGLSERTLRFSHAGGSTEDPLDTLSGWMVSFPAAADTAATGSGAASVDARTSQKMPQRHHFSSASPTNDSLPTEQRTSLSSSLSDAPQLLQATATPCLMTRIVSEASQDTGGGTVARSCFFGVEAGPLLLDAPASFANVLKASHHSEVAGAGSLTNDSVARLHQQRLTGLTGHHSPLKMLLKGRVSRSSQDPSDFGSCTVPGTIELVPPASVGEVQRSCTSQSKTFSASAGAAAATRVTDTEDDVEWEGSLPARSASSTTEIRELCRSVLARREQRLQRRGQAGAPVSGELRASPSASPSFSSQDLAGTRGSTAHSSGTLPWRQGQSLTAAASVPISVTTSHSTQPSMHLLNPPSPQNLCLPAVRVSCSSATTLEAAAVAQGEMAADHVASTSDRQSRSSSSAGALSSILAETGFLHSAHNMVDEKGSRPVARRFSEGSSVPPVSLQSSARDGESLVSRLTTSTPHIFRRETGNRSASAPECPRAEGGRNAQSTNAAAAAAAASALVVLAMEGEEGRCHRHYSAFLRAAGASEIATDTPAARRSSGSRSPPCSSSFSSLVERGSYGNQWHNKSPRDGVETRASLPGSPSSPLPPLHRSSVVVMAPKSERGAAVATTSEEVASPVSSPHLNGPVTLADIDVGELDKLEETIDALLKSYDPINTRSTAPAATDCLVRSLSASASNLGLATVLPTTTAAAAAATAAVEAPRRDLHKERISLDDTSDLHTGCSEGIRADHHGRSRKLSEFSEESEESGGDASALWCGEDAEANEKTHCGAVPPAVPIPPLDLTGLLLPTQDSEDLQQYRIPLPSAVPLPEEAHRRFLHRIGAVSAAFGDAAPNGGLHTSEYSDEAAATKDDVVDAAPLGTLEIDALSPSGSGPASLMTSCSFSGDPHTRDSSFISAASGVSSLVKERLQRMHALRRPTATPTDNAPIEKSVRRRSAVATEHHNNCSEAEENVSTGEGPRCRRAAAHTAAAMAEGNPNGTSEGKEGEEEEEEKDRGAAPMSGMCASPLRRPARFTDDSDALDGGRGVDRDRHVGRQRHRVQRVLLECEEQHARKTLLVAESTCFAIMVKQLRAS